MMNLQGRIALVTGGAVRIGRAICMELAGRGCCVVIHYNRSACAAEELKAELSASGVDTFTVQASLNSQSECEAMLTAAWQLEGHLDILVNNAGIFARQTLLAASEVDFERHWRVNCLAPMMLTRAFAARRKELAGAPAPRGSVVNLLDRRVAAVEAGCLPYLLSKKALAEFTHSAALELAPGVRVNAVAPGAVLPPPSVEGGQESEVPVKDHAGPAPLEHQCTPQDVARAVAFLVEAESITGQILFVDGGQHLHGAGNA